MENQKKWWEKPNNQLAVFGIAFGCFALYLFTKKG